MNRNSDEGLKNEYLRVFNADQLLATDPQVAMRIDVVCSLHYNFSEILNSVEVST